MQIVSTVSELSRSTANAFAPLYIIHPVVRSADLATVAEVARLRPVYTVCDHYVHAEWVSRLAVQNGITINILIEINTGLNAFGIRPGADLRELSQGLVTLPGLTMQGMATRLEPLRILTPTYEQIEYYVPQPREIDHAVCLLNEMSGRMFAERLVGSARYLITQCPSESEGVTCLNGESSPSPLPANPPEITATVLSRSKLERAVIDVGDCVGAGPWTFATGYGRPLKQCRFERIASNFSTLYLGPDSQNLRIGDELRIYIRGIANPPSNP